MRTAVAGTKASTLRDGEDEYDITVELAPRFKDDLQSVLSLRIPGRIDTSPNTFPVPLRPWPRTTSRVGADPSATSIRTSS